VPTWVLWWWQHARPIGETLKVWAETIAYGSGGVFLIYKVLSGYFIADLSLKVSCERFATGQGMEILAASAILKKGDKGTIRIHDAKVRISDDAGNVFAVQRMTGIDRLSFETEKDRMKILFNSVSKTPWLSLPPGDETQFVGLCRVPSGQLCLVEFVILGRKLWGGKTAQWRASTVSLPKGI
jgi:hypothetical protein